ncbi:site-specific DNA-methyltransferase [Nocardioides astragali]|uniref:Site-specific DNA-methyltransferase n=1 Tax=Nocardioides astragali TaxID=1776736 RepID=A0ABW2N5E3_9ACTN|nr:site-specific DNA-methyltransferase [Nocardioides astragali]
MSSVARAATPTAAETLERLIRERETGCPGYWDFADSPRRGGGHAFFQYPAMMVPELQGALLDDLLTADPSVRRVYDPFMGSGTVLLESIYRGLDFHGVDINPMAVLLSHVKAAPPSAADALAAVTRVVAAARQSSIVEEHAFIGVEKWFQPIVRGELSKLRAAIQADGDLEMRRFLWVCMAETVRLVSNSRTSTVKLHSYSATDLSNRRPQAINMFESIGKTNSTRAGEHWTRIARAQPDSTRSSAPVVNIQRASILSEIIGPGSADAIMSSPPYGDNGTTVTYGQHSYLPLQWIPRNDLVGSFDETLLESTARIDSLSLGGSKIGALKDRAEIEEKSSALADFLPLIDNRPDLLKKVVAFSRDYEAALGRATSPLRVSGFSFWTLGERRVGKQAVPLVRITKDFLALHGHDSILVIDRILPQKRKRMAATNHSGATMSKEHILVTVKAR